MPTAMNVIDKRYKFENTDQLSINTKEIRRKPSTNDYYFSDSEFYNIRGGFTAELIQNPAFKIIRTPGLQEQIIKDLKKVTLAAFRKHSNQEDIYTPDNVMLKNCILVDYLTIIRKDSEIVAFASSSFLEKNILYENASMVNPDYQGSVGLGMIPPMYVWRKIFEIQPDRIETLKIAGRTCNPAVVSMLGHVLDDMVVSGQHNIDKTSQKLFVKIADKLKCELDPKSGVIKNVYPPDLPKCKTSKNYEEMFEKLGPTDGFLLTGKTKYMHVMRLLKRETEILQNEEELKMIA